MFQWESRLADFSTGAADPRVGMFLSSLKICDCFFCPHAIKKPVPSSLVSHTEIPEQNGEKKKTKKKKKKKRQKKKTKKN